MKLEEAYGSGLYPKVPLRLVRGEGARVWDSTGREYIDCVAGHGVGIVGHSNPYVIEAVSSQVRKLVICSESFYNEERALLYEELLDLFDGRMGSVFLCNSGTEAVEAAIKFARLITGRKKIVALKRSFHGRTFGSLSATWNPKYREPFEPLVPMFAHIDPENEEELFNAVDEDTAALIFEPVQGEGGVYPLKSEFLKLAQKVCEERGALFIADEIQTGFCCTGRYFAFQRYDLSPDIVCLAKGMGGGLPVGAVVMKKSLGKLPPKTHGSTFGGNPLSCAAARAAIRYMKDKELDKRAERLGELFLNGLREIKSPVIREVRGLGLMVGIDLKRRSAPYLKALASKGVLALQAGPTVMRFLPPLVITERDIERVTLAVKEVLSLE